MDTFIEQIVPGRKSVQAALLKAIIWVAAILIILILLSLSISQQLHSFGIVFVALAVGAGYLAWRFSTGMNVEFEYSITNGYFDIDKITARRKRRRVLSTQLKEFESFGRYKMAEQEHRDYTVRIIAASPASENLWCASLRNPEKGHVLLVIEPDERVLAAIQKGLPRLVARDAFGQ